MKRLRFYLGFVLFLFFIGMTAFVDAVSWDPSSYSSPYYFLEDEFTIYNFTTNLSDISDFSHFVVLEISWLNGILGPDHDDFYWLPWRDTMFDNSTLGLLNISSNSDNETGNFTLNVLAQGSGGGASRYFEFIVNATNDIPYFLNLNSSYDFPQLNGSAYTINALDEEEHYPLFFNLTFINNCTHAAWSGRNDNENCSIFNLTSITSTSVDFNFTNPDVDDVGVYWANFSVMDSNATCPHQYCNASEYEVNKSSAVYTLRFNVFSSLFINASDCYDFDIVEGEEFNCTINVTTREEIDEINFSSFGDLVGTWDYEAHGSNGHDWFLADTTNTSSSFFYSLPVSITPGKSQVGNWEINVSVDDGNLTRTDTISGFVNYTESAVVLDSISNITIYDDYVIYVNATDEDLLVQDYDVKREDLTFSSNESVSRVFINKSDEDHTKNYVTAGIFINHSRFLEDYGSEGNYTVNFSVVDTFGNVDWQIFNVEVYNVSFPEWNDTLSDPVILNLTEDSSFFYNVSVNASDEAYNLSFYYLNTSGEACFLSDSNFNSSGIINFTPTDCGVGMFNFSFIASNGYLNSSWDFVFNVSNVFDLPVINSFTGDNGSQLNILEGNSFLAPEGVALEFELVLEDDDLFILDENEGYYDESFSVNVSFVNGTGVYFDFFNFSFLDEGIPLGNYVRYNATFTPDIADIGDYTVFVNISDASGNLVNRTWYLNVTGRLDAPNISVNDKYYTFHDVLNFTLTGTDDEDDYNGLDLTYFLDPITAGAPNLSLVGDLVYFNFSSNESYIGVWDYNASVNDSDDMWDWEVFSLLVYGNASNFSALLDFDLEENLASIMNFSINHTVGDNLTYEFWIDDVSCWFTNSTLNCSYANLSLRDSVSGLGNGSVFGFNFTPEFTDETYGLEKNLTLRVYPATSQLNSTQKASVAVNFTSKLNITHANAPVVFYSYMPDDQASSTDVISYNLSNYFSDADVSDPYYNQELNLTVLSATNNSSIDANSNYSVPANFVLSGWILNFSTLNRSVEFSEIVNVTVGDVNASINLTIGSDSSNDFMITFIPPVSVSNPSTGGSSGSSRSSTKLKIFSLRIVVPEDVVISDENYIDVPFGLENTGTMDVRGIDLASQVLYNNAFAEGVYITLPKSYIEELKSGESQEYTMRIYANTSRSGKYKATLFANVSSPKFSDWGDFFIDLRRTNESEAKELLVFTEKIISDNPECLELTEVFRRAQDAYDEGNHDLAIKLAEEVSAACEDAILANEQVRYRLEGFIERNFYYMAFITVLVFFTGLVFYTWKRVRFNKSVEDEYIR